MTTQTSLAIAASSSGVVMGVAPVLQIRRMLRERSSAQVSLGYFVILLTGFVLWIGYGVSLRNLALVIPNSVALLVTAAVITVAMKLRRPQTVACPEGAGSAGRLRRGRAAGPVTRLPENAGE
jgi:MtN3 and saliva related transmembrane protein